MHNDPRYAAPYARAQVSFGPQTLRAKEKGDQMAALPRYFMSLAY